MPHAIRIHAYGGPEEMRWEAVAAVAPGRGEALVRQTAVGLNFIDIYERTGLYGGTLPTGLGREAAGVVEAVGPGVHDFKVGHRIAYASNSPGAYTDERVLPVASLVPVPEGVSDAMAGPERGWRAIPRRPPARVRDASRCRPTAAGRRTRRWVHTRRSPRS
jgi:NADPH2:quinone reductase